MSIDLTVNEILFPALAATFHSQDMPSGDEFGYEGDEKSPEKLRLYSAPQSVN